MEPNIETKEMRSEVEYFNTMEITIHCRNKEMTSRVSAMIHNQLAQHPDYIENRIILSDTNGVPNLEDSIGKNSINIAYFNDAVSPVPIFIDPVAICPDVYEKCMITVDEFARKVKEMDNVDITVYAPNNEKVLDYTFTRPFDLFVENRMSQEAFINKRILPLVRGLDFDIESFGKAKEKVVVNAKDTLGTAPVGVTKIVGGISLIGITKNNRNGTKTQDNDHFIYSFDSYAYDIFQMKDILSFINDNFIRKARVTILDMLIDHPLYVFIQATTGKEAIVVTTSNTFDWIEYNKKNFTQEGE